jgi:hypothetical protein
MNQLKLTFLIFFFLISQSFAGIKVIEWNEEAQLTDYGRVSKFLIHIQAVGLPQNVGINSFSITSSSNRGLTISKVRVNALSAQSLSEPNSFEIFFKKPLLNNQFAYIEYEAKDTYDKINKYIRQEPFYIPQFAHGAKANISLDFGEDYELISSHKNIIVENKKVLFNGVVPSAGLQEALKITNSFKVWDVLIKSKILFNGSEGELEITAPYLFRGGAQEVQNQTIGANKAPKKHITNRDNDVLTFDIKPENKEIIIQNKAVITTGKKYAVENNRLIEKYLEISPNEEMLLKPILQQINADPQYGSIPLHAKIVNFVNKAIKYDFNYFGKLLTVEQILQTRAGVCSEFATLFNALARVAKIPSSIVHGYAFGEYNKFESHAWNMIFVNNKWVYVDPTWNLSSGMVSSSHIYIKDNRKEELLLQFKGKGTDIKIDREFQIKEIPQK